MTITVKRTCESNVHYKPEKIQINSFTVSFMGPEMKQLQGILDGPGKPKISEVLTWILYRGLDKQVEIMIRSGTFPEASE